MVQQVNVNTMTSEQQVAFYGLLFHAAAIDTEMSSDELSQIFEICDLTGLNKEDQQRVRMFIVEPPNLVDCLRPLISMDESLRFGILMAVIDVLLADDMLTREETELIENIRKNMHITSEQVEQMIKFLRNVKRLKESGLDDNELEKGIKNAAAGLAGVGVPLAAVYFSGSVIGFSAAGITSGLAAVGLGLGMVPGIGILVVIGAATFFSISYLCGQKKKTAKQTAQAERERKAQLVIKNLQLTINAIIERMDNLQTSAREAETNREIINLLRERLHKLLQVVNRRKAMAGA